MYNRLDKTYYGKTAKALTKLRMLRTDSPSYCHCDKMNQYARVLLSGLSFEPLFYTHSDCLKKLDLVKKISFTEGLYINWFL